MEQKNEPDKIVYAGGREFRLYRYKDEFDGKYILDLPDFDENPEYTGEGRPFTLNVQDSCVYARSRDPAGNDPGDCGGCGWFHREEPYAPIGVCMCDELRQTMPQPKEE